MEDSNNVGGGNASWMDRRKEKQNDEVTDDEQFLNDHFWQPSPYSVGQRIWRQALNNGQVRSTDERRIGRRSSSPSRRGTAHIGKNLNNDLSDKRGIAQDSDETRRGETRVREQWEASNGRERECAGKGENQQPPEHISSLSANYTRARLTTQLRQPPVSLRCSSPVTRPFSSTPPATQHVPPQKSNHQTCSSPVRPLQTVSVQPVTPDFHARPPPANSSLSVPPSQNGRHSHSSREATTPAPSKRRRRLFPSNVTPIDKLNVYMNRWTICARVIAKSDIHVWSHFRTEEQGRVFNIELIDSSNMDMRAAFFNDQVDKFYDMLHVDQIYTFSNGRIRLANRQFNLCKSNLEVIFGPDAVIRPVVDSGNDDDDVNNNADAQRGENIPHQPSDYTKIRQLEYMEVGKIVDILAIVKDIGEVDTVRSSKNDGREVMRCALLVSDDSNTEINLTVWSDTAKKAREVFANNPVVAFRHARITDFLGERTLSASPIFVVNPRIHQTEQLKRWWDNVGSKNVNRIRNLSSFVGPGSSPPLHERKDITAVIRDKMEEHEHHSNRSAHLVSFKGTFYFTEGSRIWYEGCSNPGDPCRNRPKVERTDDGNWLCAKCQRRSATCVRRFVINGTVMDDTSTTPVTIFNDQAETLFGGMTADDIYLRSCKDDAFDTKEYESCVAHAEFTEWVFTCRVRQQRLVVFALHPVDYSKESLDLLDSIAKF